MNSSEYMIRYVYEFTPHHYVYEFNRFDPKHLCKGMAMTRNVDWLTAMVAGRNWFYRTRHGSGFGFADDFGNLIA